MSKENALLWVENVSKSFPGVQALEGVSLHVNRGEVLGLIGQNGAGKSTLMKILSGVYGVDQGTIYVEGQPVQLQTPHQAQELGIAIIYQELNLIPNLTVMENIFVGREPGTGFLVSRPQLQRQTQTILDHLKLAVRPTAIVRNLSVAEQQMVEIAKNISRQVKVLILDEPTSALSESEVNTLFTVIEELKQNGIGIIFISHRLEEVLQVCDRVTVLRDGKQVGDVKVREVNKEDLIRLMVGRTLETFFHQAETGVSGPAAAQDVVLEVRNLSRRSNTHNPNAHLLSNISFQLLRGEILGLAGLVGAGRTELVRTLFGADRRDSGEILLEGQAVRITSPEDAIRLGIGLVPEDRKAQGLILNMAVRQNMSLANLDGFSRLGFVRRRGEGRSVQEYMQRFQIRTPSMERPVVHLSGGNQQKVVIAKWLMVQPKILIMDEPTRGVDVGAKSEIYELMHQLVASGISIIMISSEFPELLAMADRIVCLCEGHITGTWPRSQLTVETLMRYCTFHADPVEESKTVGQ